MFDEITDQLGKRGISFADLATYARPLDDHECLLLVGSIAEGLGNADSDVDLMLIGARGRTDTVRISQTQCDAETVLPTELAEISIETFEPEQLLQLAPIMTAAAAAFDAPEDATDLPVLNNQEEAKLLHRLANGIPLVNSDVVDEWRHRLRLDAFREIFALSSSIKHFADRENGLSHVLEGDFDTASVCFRESASEAAAVLLAAVGQTQPSTRWRLRVLQRHRDELGHEHVDALIAAMLDRVSTREDVERLLVMFDAVVLRAAQLLPRVAHVGARIAAHFPVHSHLTVDDGIGALLTESVMPTRRPNEPTVVSRMAAAERVAKARQIWATAPLAIMRTVDAGGPRGVTVDGIPSIILAANDYLGLRWHPKVLEGAERALRGLGSGAAGSRLMAGSTRLHKELEQELAAFLRRDAALLFPTGYQANVGVLSALLGRDDLAICDDGVHASLLDGSRLAHATIRRISRYQRSTVDRILEVVDTGRHPGSVLVADAVYSMDGDTFPLERFVEWLGDRPDPLVLLDEAHAVGVIGEDGRGLTANHAAGQRVQLITGNLSKAMASSGGFVAGSRELIDSLSALCRSSLFSTAGNPAAIGAALAALRVLQDEPERRTRVHELSRQLRAGLRELHLDTGNSDTPIIPCVVGDEERAIRLAHVLGERGICVGCALPPAVPRNRAMLRMSVSASHTPADISRTLETLADVLRDDPVPVEIAGPVGLGVEG